MSFSDNGFGCGPVPFDPTDCILTGMSPAVLTANLAAAQLAYHQLMIGAAVVTLSIAQGDGSRTVSRLAPKPELLVQYIRLLQAALGINTMGRRPVRFNFV